MALSARSRRSRIQDVGRLLGDSTPIRGYGQAVEGPSPAQTITVLLLGAVVFALVVSLAVGGFVAPGFLVLLFVYWAINPPRAVALTDDSVVLLKRSRLTAKPTAVIGRFPLDVLTSVGPNGSYWRFLMGSDNVWVSKKEYAGLTGHD